MKNYTLIFASIIAQLVSCQNRKMGTCNSPLVSIIKMHAAEALLDFSEAKKYENVDKIYRDLATVNATPEDIWREYMTSLKMAAKSKIFTNQSKYFEFDISEEIEGAKANVTFKTKNLGSNIRAIIYKLDYQQSVWIVNSIKFDRKD